MSEMTHLHEWDDSFIWVRSHICMNEITQLYEWDDSSVFEAGSDSHRDRYVCDTNHLYVRHDLILWVAYRISKRGMTCSCLWREEWLTYGNWCVTWFIAMTRFSRTDRYVYDMIYLHIQHDSFWCCLCNWVMSYMPSVGHDSFTWHDSFSVGHDSFTWHDAFSVGHDSFTWHDAFAYAGTGMTLLIYISSTHRNESWGTWLIAMSDKTHSRMKRYMIMCVCVCLCACFCVGV